MGRDTENSKRILLDKVGNAISCIDEAKHVDEVIVALYSLAACLFPLEPNSISGCLDEKYADKIRSLEVPSVEERTEWRNLFYKYSGFRAFSRVLLYDIACNWLSCFPTSARQSVYDVFFRNGCASEVVLLLVPCLQQRGGGSYDNKIVCSNVERLVVLCFLENDMVFQTANEFTEKCLFEDISHGEHKDTISRVAQLITCIPDKARRGAPISLSSHLYFKTIIGQLLHGLEVWNLELVDKSAAASGFNLTGGVCFIGEVFSRISRRGAADVLLSELSPQILGHVRSILSSTSGLDIREIFESKPYISMWSKIVEALNDSHSVERIAEELLHQLAVLRVNDVEGYWVLWILFGQICKRQPSIRFIFVDKFLLWKEFPICCLRWILYFAVLECPPDCPPERNSYNARSLSETVQRLVVAWSKTEFVQSCSTEKQTYVTAALGLCLEKMTKEVFDTAKESLPLILQGISGRLESPVYLTRKMASNIALVFSKIIDPQNPLYLDDECQEDSIDWEFGLAARNKEALAISGHSAHLKSVEGEDYTIARVNEAHNRHNDIVITSENKNEIISNLHDPGEVIDPASLIDGSFAGDDYCSDSDDSETSSNSSLQPYDLADDDADLKKKFSQLVDVVGALRKSDDAEGVENALDVAETLIRALPEELKYVAGDLAKTLVQVRCCDSTIEGEEESAEEKRQKALVALIVACPVETLDSLNKLIYSPNLDISQRIMIFDVMTNAAEELASTRVLKSEQRHKPLITSTSDQPWFVPRDIGPPGAGRWKEISSTGTPLNWSYSYERELPLKADKIKKGKSRRWSSRSGVQGNQVESQNLFPQYAASFMLPVMQGFDKKRHGVDLLGRDFIVLGKLIYMLGVCIKCAAMHPEASVLAFPLLDMLRSREICHHREAFVRKSVLFAGSCVLLALHPTYVASAIQGNTDISEGLEWLRSWALQVAESDTDRECHTLAMTCLHLHAEMALEATRALESSSAKSSVDSISLFPSVSTRSIKIPFLSS